MKKENRFNIPPLKDGVVESPELKVNASAHIKCHYATPEELKCIGFPSQLPKNWKEIFLLKMEELLGKYKSLKLFLDICVKCGACTDKCHYFLGTGDPNNMPVGRQELMRKVYRKYFTAAGKLPGSFVNAEELTKKLLEEWATYFYQCSQCRRCSIFCPFGIDTAEITIAARELLLSVGIGQKYSLEVIGNLHRTGNNIGIPKPALADTLKFLEDDIKDSSGVDVALPLDKNSADALLVVPSADFFSSPHVDSLVGYAKVFHASGISYTFSSYASEFANFGLFMGDQNQMKIIAERIYHAAKELGVKRVIVGECGHAWRIAYSFWKDLLGEMEFLSPEHREPMHICEFTNSLIKSGAVKLDRSANDDLTVTYHDSCNVARASSMGRSIGGQFDIPREILKACCNNFVEMNPRTNRQETFCCGGGGGLLTDEVMELRVKGSAPKIAALKDVMDKRGVNRMAMICAICKSQFTEVFKHYEIPMETVTGVHSLVSNAIKL